MKIFSHLSKEYKDHCKKFNITTNNGAFYYSKEIYENIIPRIKTDRNWVLVNIDGCCYDHAIVFIHNNKNPEHYYWLKDYKDLILVCSNIKTLKFMIEMFPKFHCILIPLSIDKKYVEKFKVKRKTKDTVYFGRLEKCPVEVLENDKIDKIVGNERDKLLKEVAKYKNAYAIGRCALEAKCLNCNVKSHRGEYKNIDFKLLDNSEIIPELQQILNDIDKVKE